LGARVGSCRVRILFIKNTVSGMLRNHHMVVSQTPIAVPLLSSQVTTGELGQGTRAFYGMSVYPLEDMFRTSFTCLCGILPPSCFSLHIHI
jgi:hypothetical protein